MNPNVSEARCVCCGLLRRIDKPCPNILCFLYGPDKTFAAMREAQPHKLASEPWGKKDAVARGETKPIAQRP